MSIVLEVIMGLGSSSVRMREDKGCMGLQFVYSSFCIGPGTTVYIFSFNVAIWVNRTKLTSFIQAFRRFRTNRITPLTSLAVFRTRRCQQCDVLVFGAVC